jgi:gliding motility-associated-like protein
VQFDYSIAIDDGDSLQVVTSGFGVGLLTNDFIQETLNNVSDRAQRVVISITPYTVTNTGMTRCTGIINSVDIWVEPTARVFATIDNDTICNDGSININWVTPTIPTVDVVFNVDIVNPYPEISNYTGGTGLSKLDDIANSLNNSGDTARMIMYVISPVLLDNNGNQKCPGTNDTIRLWINPTQRVIPFNDALRICSDAYTSITLTSPTVMTKGLVYFDYVITKTVVDSLLTGNSDTALMIFPDHHVEFRYFNHTDTIQSVKYHVVPRVTELGCSDGDTVTVEVKVHPEPIQGILITNPVTCTGGSDAALMAVLARGAAPYSLHWTGPDDWTADDIVEATNLYEGLYEIFVTDSLGCTNMMDTIIYRPAENITFAPILKAPNYTYNSTCNGSMDGEINLWITNGISEPYHYIVETAEGVLMFEGVLTGNRTPGDTTTYKRFSNLAPIQYLLTVTDINGCVSYRSTYISEPPPITINTAAYEFEGGYNIDCRGRSTGSAWVVSSFGGNVGPHVYEWSTTRDFQPGTVTPGSIIENLPAGTYYIKATDTMGCIKIDSIELREPDGIELIAYEISFSADSAYNVSCAGGNNGSINLTFGGGTGPYIYNWVNYPAGANIVQGLKDQTGLIAGVYDLLVVDANGCDRPYSWTLTEPDTLKLAYVVSATIDDAYNINCNGGTGTIDLTVTGGSIGNYTYIWNTENGSGIIPGDPNQPGLTAGNYLITVIDSNGCFVESEIELKQPDPITTIITPTHITCESPGFDNGSISLAVTGGSEGSYTYLWSNGATTKDISGLGEGEYSVIITDLYGCQAFDTTFINLPPPLLISIDKSNYLGFNVSCYGMSDGWLEVTVTSGEAPYIYQWSGPDGFSSTESRITGLKAGLYSITVTDGNMCTISEFVGVDQPGRLHMNITLSQSDFGLFNINCYGSSSGFISLEEVNSVGNIQWLWSDGATTNLRTSLPAGDYSVILIDENGCVADTAMTLTQPDSIQIAFVVTQPECLDNPNGTITLDITGGVAVAGYNYLWSDGSTQGDRDNLLPGNYRLRVTDLNGCVAVDSVKLEALNEICLDIPNAFSPNGDLINDVWNIGMIYLYPKMEVTIFNRWGEVVWKSERGYPVAWDGRSNGRPLPVDSYHYTIDLNNGRKLVVGHVTIVR